MAHEYWIQRVAHEQALDKMHLEEQVRTAHALRTADLGLLKDQYNVAQILLKQQDNATQMFRDLEQQTQLTRALMGPLDELRRAALFPPSGLFEQAEWIEKLRSDFESQFRLPNALEAIRLAESALIGPVLRLAGNLDLQESIRNMTTPWLDVRDEVRGVAGFTELQGIGHALETESVFSSDFSAALRSDFGDWRDSISWPQEIFTDLVVRSDFYLGLGFNPALADFPAPAFEQGLQMAGLVTERPRLVARYGSPVMESDDKTEEEALGRTNRAHDWIIRLEQQLRRFIDEKMTQLRGPNWFKHRLPTGLYDEWREKEKKAGEQNGEPLRLIAYADFTDYERLICRDDNWKEVFSNVFERKESVRESFQRLYPIRIATMHARLISQDDELFLFVEIKRLMRIINEFYGAQANKQ